MAVEHDLIMNKGLSDALREAQSGQERANLRVAADILEQSAERPEARSFLHSVLCTIYLPHRRTAPDAVWQRHNGDGATLMIQPTKDELRAARGVNSIYHNNGIQTWYVKADGAVENVEVS